MTIRGRSAGRGVAPGWRAAGEAGDGFAGVGSGQGEVVGGWEVEPEFGGGGEPVGEAQRGVGGDAALGVDDLGDAVGRHGELAGEFGGGGAGCGEVFGENFAGVRGGGHEGDRSMGITLYVMRSAEGRLPDEFRACQAAMRVFRKQSCRWKREGSLLEGEVYGETAGTRCL